MAGRKRKSWKHILFVFLASFLIAAVVGIGSELLMRRTSIVIAWLMLLIVIGLNILFDIIGTAAAAATEAPHHAKAANRVFGANQAVYLIRNADVVANFANDIVGDVTGTVSGAMAATIVMDLIRLYSDLEPHEIWLNTGMLALVASVTVTGKALGKSFAINEADDIIGAVGVFIATLERITGRSFTGRKKRGGRKNGAARKHP